MTLVPEIDDQTLEERAARIKPVARFMILDNALREDDSGDLYFVKTPKDLRRYGVNRCPVAVRPASNLVLLDRIKTYHTASSMLCASVAEVLAQIPSNLLRLTSAFEVTHPFPCPSVTDGMDSYHETVTRLYWQAPSLKR